MKLEVGKKYVCSLGKVWVIEFKTSWDDFVGCSKDEPISRTFYEDGTSTVFTSPSYNLIKEYIEPKVYEYFIRVGADGLIAWFSDTESSSDMPDGYVSRKIRYTVGGKIEDITEESK